VPSERELFALVDDNDEGLNDNFDVERIGNAANTLLTEMAGSGGRAGRIIVTCGPDGVVACGLSEGGGLDVKHFVGTGNLSGGDIVSTSGAGDTFAGVFVSYMMVNNNSSVSEDEAIRRGIIAAEKTCRVEESVAEAI